MPTGSVTVVRALPQLAALEGRQRQRKTVTVVFCDVVGSTALGESSDPEAGTTSNRPTAIGSSYLYPMSTRARSSGAGPRGIWPRPAGVPSLEVTQKVSADLLRRVADLLPEHSRERLELLPDLGEALTEIGEFGEAQRFLDAMTAVAAIGDPILEADAILTRLLLARYTVADLDGWRRDAKRETHSLIPLLQGEKAVAVRTKAWRLLSFVHGTVCLWEATAEALTHAIAAARLAGEGRLVARLSSAYVIALADGPTPAPKAIERAEEILNDELIGREAEALIMLWVAPLHAMSSDFDQARELVSRATEILNDLGTVLIGVIGVERVEEEFATC
jgi:hypothetical protein